MGNYWKVEFLQGGHEYEFKGKLTVGGAGVVGAFVAELRLALETEFLRPFEPTRFPGAIFASSNFR